MKKVLGLYAIIWAILLAVFNVFCFATPNELAGFTKFDGTFWTAYAFISAAFIGNLVCAFIAFKSNDAKKVFYNIPIVKISYACLITMIVFGILVMAVPNLQYWIGIIVCLLILIFNAIAVVKAKAAADIVENIDDKVTAQTLFVKALTVDADKLLTGATTPESKEACKKVYEAVRYSDPMSSEALKDVENQITLKFDEFSNAVKTGADNVKTIADELVILIGDRNKKCKLVK